MLLKGDLSRLIMLMPTTTWAMLSKTKAIMKSHRGLQQGTLSQPEYAEAYYNMGIALQDQGKLDEAVSIYNKARYPA